MDLVKAAVEYRLNVRINPKIKRILDFRSHKVSIEIQGNLLSFPTQNVKSIVGSLVDSIDIRGAMSARTTLAQRNLSEVSVLLGVRGLRTMCPVRPPRE